jgi:predicted transcriptional regulator
MLVEDNDMKTQKWAEVKARKLSPAKVAEVRRRADEEVLEINLRALRAELGKTQSEVAAMADMTQSEVSKIEQREDWLVSTLRRYVHALGGELEVVAVIGKKRIPLQGMS